MWKNAIYLFGSIFLISLALMFAIKITDKPYVLTNDPEPSIITEPTESQLPGSGGENGNVYAKIKNNTRINILSIGDSIGQSAGASNNDNKWYNQLKMWLNDKYNIDSNVQLITTSGGTAFGGWIDYIYSEIKDSQDLVFLCFGANDQAGKNENLYSNLMESIIRRVKTNNPNTEMILLIENSVKDEKYADKVKELSAYYDLNYIDTREGFKASGMQYEELSTDLVHPNDEGYKVYCSQIYKLIEDNMAMGREPKYENKEILYAGTEKYDTGSIITEFIDKKGFEDSTSKENRGYWSSNVKGNYITYSFNKSVLGLYFLGGPECGIANIYIDNKLIRTYDCYMPFVVERQILIGDNIEPGEHTVKIEVSGQKNKDATDCKVNIHGIVTN